MPPQNQTWTILAILNATSDYFLNHAIENPRLNAERLLAHTLNCDRLDLYLQFERKWRISGNWSRDGQGMNRCSISPARLNLWDSPSV